VIKKYGKKGKMVEAEKFSPSDPKKSLENKEENTYRKKKDRKRTENLKRGIVQLKNMAKQTDDRVN
jgi:hypothetical protein